MCLKTLNARLSIHCTHVKFLSLQLHNTHFFESFVVLCAHLLLIHRITHFALTQLSSVQFLFWLFFCCRPKKKHTHNSTPSELNGIIFTMEARWRRTTSFVCFYLLFDVETFSAPLTFFHQRSFRIVSLSYRNTWFTRNEERIKVCLETNG